MPMNVRPLKKTFTNSDELAAIDMYVQTQVEYLRNKTRMFRETLLPKWDKIYKGKPEVDRKTFPWPEASNLVIQVAATHSDELLSRVMSIFQNEALYIAQIYGDYQKGIADDEREIIEKFMADQAWSPEELDLYRVEEAMFASAIRFGTGICYIPFRYETEQVFTGTEASPFSEEVLVNGPRPENVPLNKFLIDTQTPTLRDSKFFCRIATYKRHELQDLVKSISETKKDEEIWDKSALQEMLDGSADRQGSDYFQRSQEEPKGMTNETPTEAADEYDIYECWFAWMYGGKKYRIIVHWHAKSYKRVGGLFNAYPKNQVPFEDAKLAYDDDQYYGYGFCEMLEAYQKEVSTVHNQRIDNRNLANTGAMRIAPGSKLASIIQVYPGVVIPGSKDEVEPLPLGQTGAPLTTEDEQLTLALAKERSGVDPAVGGAGGGVVNAKRGIYSAQGTAIAMQASNNRNSLRMSDMRSAHVRIASKILQQYADFGLDGRILRKYGDDSTTLKKALMDIQSGKLGLIVKPATASTNKELEKQNDILLMQTLSQAQQSDINMMAMLNQAGANEEMKQFIQECIAAKNTLLRRLFRNFNHPDVERLAPLPEFIRQQRMQQNAQQALAAQAASRPNNSPFGNRSAIPIASGSGSSGIPQLAGGQSGGNIIQ